MRQQTSRPFLSPSSATCVVSHAWYKKNQNWKIVSGAKINDAVSSLPMTEAAMIDLKPAHTSFSIV